MGRSTVAWARPLVVAALVVVVLSGCGDDGEQRSMTVVGTEMAFDAPDRTIEGDYTVTFRNAGTAYHELAFRNPSGDFVARRSIAAGESIDLEVTLKPGTWELGCFEPGHYEAGMHRQLDVEKA